MQQQEKVQLKECAMQLLSNVSVTVTSCGLHHYLSCVTQSTPLYHRHISDISFASHQGTHSILEEESHIKDALSRITVEMIKREWPQHWPDMLKEMGALTSQGVSNCFRD